MIIGKWNKSVILTYIGLLLSVLGIFLSFTNENILLSLSCLIGAGVCDLFDGFIARKCKRTEEEKRFGIELDSLVDAIDFIALPIAICISLKLTAWYNLIIYVVFAICGIARLAYFNIKTDGGDISIKYYSGLPVTYSALIFPLGYLLSYVVQASTFNIIYSIIMLLVAIFNVLNIKVKKPKTVGYIIFSLLAIVMLVLYLGVL